MLYRFSDEEKELLLALALGNAVACSAEYDAGRAGELFDENRKDFLMACRIVAELHAPSAPPMPTAVYERGANPMNLSIVDDPAMAEIARSEGIDLGKELGAFDPRANHPKCIHSRKFSEPCVDCSPDAGPFKFQLGEEEQAALDGALAERTGQDFPHVELVAELERVPARSVAHRDSCPVAHEHFVIDGATRCTCDFGQRLAEELGMPYGTKPGRRLGLKSHSG